MIIQRDANSKQTYQMRHQFVNKYFKMRLKMSFDFDALFDLHRLIVCRISFFMMKSDDFKTMLK
jgi:hypothetical protein